MTDDPDADAAREATGGGLAALAAAGVGAAIGGPVGALAGALIGPVATPYATRAVEAAAEQLADRKRASAGRALDVAAESLQVEPEEVPVLAFKTPAGTQLLHDTIVSALASFDAQKVDGLGRALGLGLADDCAQIDREQLIVRALAQLDTPHVRVLSDYKPGQLGLHHDLVVARRLGIDREVTRDIFHVLASVNIVADAGRAKYEEKQRTTLQQLADNDADKGNRRRIRQDLKSKPETGRWRLTGFGRQCLRRLLGLPPWEPRPPRGPVSVYFDDEGNVIPRDADEEAPQNSGGADPRDDQGHASDPAGSSDL